MADGVLSRGAKPLSERDWIFGSRPRRQLLEGVLMGRKPANGLSRSQLAGLAGVIANGGVDEHVSGLERLGLIERDAVKPGVWHPVRPHGELAHGVRKALRALAALDDTVAERDSGNTTSARDGAIRAVEAAERSVRRAVDDLGEEAAAEVLGLLGRARDGLEADELASG